jgi:release factor glutamine methyltransferase
MFVSSNSGFSVKKYFQERLFDLYSEREIRFFFQAIVEHRLDLNSSELLLSDKLLFSESDLLYFRSVLKRLQSHEPFQYILGETFFYNIKILCDSRALIPRPETEELVDWVLDSLEVKRAYNILDICTGTGCIALALKSKLLASKIYATDLSQDALALAKKNAISLNLSVDFLIENALLGDPGNFLSDSLDVIISNPPYIPVKDKQYMEKNVLDFEPNLALFVSDDNPLIFYKAITEKANTCLKKEGLLFFELHEQYALETKELVQRFGFNSVEIKQDLQGKNRMLRAKKK